VHAGSALDLDHDRTLGLVGASLCEDDGLFVLLTTPTRLREEPAVLEAARTVRLSSAWHVRGMK
jgi:hypothetical protein